MGVGLVAGSRVWDVGSCHAHPPGCGLAFRERELHDVHQLV